LGTRARVGLLHYTCPPIIGGVETILYEQATRLAARGYPVTILSGRGGPLPDRRAAKLVIIPELDSRDTAVSAVRDALDRGEVPSEFATLRANIIERLSTELAELDVVIVHNALTLHFNLPLTAALWSLADGKRPGLVRDPGAGSAIEAEIWDVPVAAIGALLAGVAPPLGLGTIALEDGGAVTGFLCEAYAVAGAREISEFGGWRAWQTSRQERR